MDDAARNIQRKWDWYQKVGRFQKKKGKKGKGKKGKKKWTIQPFPNWLESRGAALLPLLSIHYLINIS